MGRCKEEASGVSGWGGVFSGRTILTGFMLEAGQGSSTSLGAAGVGWGRWYEESDQILKGIRH